MSSGREDHGWVERRTTEGTAYYENTKTKATSWDKPEELKSATELDVAGDWVWKPDDVEGYVPARLLKSNANGTKTVQTEEGLSHEIDKKTVLLPLNRRNLRKQTDDLVQMDAIDEGTIVHNLKERFRRDIFYTSIGTILIVVNPFRWLPLYTADIKQQYFHKGLRQLPPHIYEIADAAYRRLLDGGTGPSKMNQCVLISGESGAGKTEATKQVLDFLAHTAGSTSGIEEKLLVANPVLEAFGNAKTIRNDNSSRFGKWVEIFFDDRWRIVGGRITNYLLEKSRVVKQGEGERNYHIFYMLIKGSSPRQRTKFHLADAESFAITRGTISADTINDVAQMREMEEAMKTLGFSDQEMEDILQVVAALLHLGNVEFSPGREEKSSVVRNSDVLGVAASLLRVDVALLEKTLTSRTFRASKKEEVRIQLSPAQAANNRDALAKTVYGYMFQWLVNRINKFIEPTSSIGSLSFIGVLDIFGFEIFEKNSFEQLCINFANEKLQQHFNRHTFKLEEQLYRSEEIPFTHVEFIDNQPCLDLIEMKPGGIIALLDEELVLPKGSDASFLDKLVQKHQGTSERFARSIRPPMAFNIIHYAGTVLYDVNGFLEKNKDLLEEDLLDLVYTSQSEYLRTLFPRVSTTERKSTLGSQFKGQLIALMSVLNSTYPHYVRCIKPNAKKVSGRFEGKMVLLQLRYSGIFEAVRIRQSGYPFRYTHQEFIQRYQCLAKRETRKLKDKKELCKRILTEAGGDWSEIQIGLTRVLYRAGSHRNLELKRHAAVWICVIKCQSAFRGYRARVLFAKMKAVDLKLREAIASRELERLEACLAECKGIWFQLRSMVDARKLRDVLVEEKKILLLLPALQEKALRDPEKHYEEIIVVLRRAEAIEMSSDILQSVKVAVKKVRDVRETIEFLRLGAANFDRALLEVAIPKAEMLGIAAADVAKARQVLGLIVQEEAVVAKLDAALDAGSAQIKGLEACINEAKSFNLRTEIGKLKLKAGNVTLKLRTAFQSKLWDTLLEAVSEGGSLPMNAKELKQMQDGIHLRGRMRTVAERIDEAVQQLDITKLEPALSDAVKLDMKASIWTSWTTNVEQAEAVVQRYKAIIGAIERGLTSDTADNTRTLRSAIEQADAFGFKIEKDLTLLRKAKITLKLRVAIQSKDYALVEMAIRDADDNSYNSPELDAAREGLLLRERMAIVAASLAQHVKARDCVSCERALGEASILNMATSFWSSWASLVAEATEYVRRHKQLIETLQAGLVADTPDRTKLLKGAIVEAANFGFTVKEDVTVLAMARLVLSLREAFRAKNWLAMESTVVEAKKSRIWSAEIEAARAGLLLREKMEDIAYELEAGMEDRDSVQLKRNLEEAKALEMATSVWSSWSELVEEATGHLRDHLAIIAQLEAGIVDAEKQTDKLAVAIEDAESFVFLTAPDVKILNQAKMVMLLRERLRDLDWHGIDEVLLEAQRLSVETPEIKTAKDGMALRHNMEIVANGMSAAIADRKIPALKQELQRGIDLQMDKSFWSSWAELLVETRDLITRHEDIMEWLDRGVALDTPRNNTLLDIALKEASDFGYVQPEDIRMVKRGATMKDFRAALHALDWEKLDWALLSCQDLGMDSAEIDTVIRGLQLRSEMGKVAAKMVQAMKPVNAIELRALLIEANALNMAASFWSSWQEVAIQGQTILDTYMTVRRDINTSLSRDTPELTSLLARALEEAKKLDLSAGKDKEYIARAELHLDMRRALHNEEWTQLEKILARATTAKMQSAELDSAKLGLSLRTKMNPVAQSMKKAMAEFKSDALDVAVIEAEKLDMDVSPWSPWRQLTAEARTLALTLAELRSSIEKGLDSVDEVSLNRAVYLAEKCNHPPTAELESVRLLRDQVNWVHTAADEALCLLWPELLNRVVKRAGQIKLDTYYVDDCRTCLENIRAGSTPKTVKQVFFSQFANAAFSLRDFDNLRPELEFGERRSQVEWTKRIPTSLTNLHPNEVPMAVEFFGKLYEHMSGQIDIVPKLRTLARLPGSLRDEVYCQVIKQLTGNPSASSVALGWQVFEGCLQSFAPSNEFSSYLEWFIRQCGGDRTDEFLRYLHLSTYKPLAATKEERDTARAADYEVVKRNRPPPPPDYEQF